MDPKEQLVNGLGNPEYRSKVSAGFSGFIRDRLREASFAEQVQPPQTVDRSQCQVSTNHDALVKIEYLEPRSRAMVVSFRGESTAKYIRGEKVEVAFFTIMSEMYQKTEQEFLAYNFPIGKVIETNSVRDIGEIQDREYLLYCESSVQAIQAEVNGGTATTLNASAIQAGSVVESSVVKGEGARNATTDDGTVYPIQRPDVVRLMKALDGRRLKMEMLLITEPDADDILQWTVADQGDKVQAETLVSGFKYNTLLGKRFIRTVKTDILRVGNVYGFTDPEFLGRFYVLNNVKFYIDKVVNLIKFVAWKDLAMSIINISSVVKLELYSGDATTNDADGILSDVIPKDEADLGAPNNRAGNRQFYPGVVSF